MFNKKTVRDIDIKGKRVLVRAPLNVPIQDGKVVGEFRLEAAIPTLEYLKDQGAKVILLSHHSADGQTLEPVATTLSSLLDQKVEFLGDCLAAPAKAKIQEMKPGDITMAENLRFHAEEKNNDDSFAKSLAELGDVYVDDCFDVMHRAHASVVGIPKYLPAVAGFLVEKEVTTIDGALEDPKRPLLAIVGGAKISTKIALLNNLLPKVDAVLIGGAMANTFLAAEGKPIGKSMQETDQQELAKQIMQKSNAQKTELFLPIDVVVTEDIETAKNVRTVGVDEVGAGDIIVDLGPESIAQLNSILGKKGTVIWNGPLGITEKEAFRNGSTVLANAIVKSGATSIIGGGDTAGFLELVKLSDKFSFVSTGGGASLDLMSGNVLPGLEALQNK